MIKTEHVADLQYGELFWPIMRRCAARLASFQAGIQWNLQNKPAKAAAKTDYSSIGTIFSDRSVG